MKKILILLLLLTLAGSAQAAEVSEVVTLGKAPVTDQQATARQKAVNNAIARAVGRVAMEMVDPATLREKLGPLQQEIISRASNFVSTYSLVSEAVAGQELVVLVSAKVDRASLATALAEAGLRLPEMNFSQTLVLVSEESAPGRPAVFWWSGAPGIPPAPGPVAQVLASLGVQTVDPAVLAGQVPAASRTPVLSEQQALAIAGQAGACMVILGRVRTYPMVTPEGELPPPVAQLMALDVEAAKTLSIIEAEGPLFHQTPGPSATDQVTQSVEMAMRQLLEEVASAGSASPAEASQVSLHLSGITTLAQLHGFEDALLSLSPLVTSVQRDSVGAGWASFVLTLSGAPSKLADRLLIMDLGDFLVNVVDVTPDGIKLVLLPKN